MVFVHVYYVLIMVVGEKWWWLTCFYAFSEWSTFAEIHNMAFVEQSKLGSRKSQRRKLNSIELNETIDEDDDYNPSKQNSTITNNNNAFLKLKQPAKKQKKENVTKQLQQQKSNFCNRSAAFFAALSFGVRKNKSLDWAGVGATCLEHFFAIFRVDWVVASIEDEEGLFFSKKKRFSTYIKI